MAVNCFVAVLWCRLISVYKMLCISQAFYHRVLLNYRDHLKRRRRCKFSGNLTEHSHLISLKHYFNETITWQKKVELRNSNIKGFVYIFLKRYFNRRKWRDALFEFSYFPYTIFRAYNLRFKLSATRHCFWLGAWFTCLPFLRCNSCRSQQKKKIFTL